jgi:hypothetical protein
VPSIQAIRNFIGEWEGVLAGLFLGGIGIFEYCKLRPESLAHQLAEASIIAGVVAISVDPFLKRRLLKEASKDIDGYPLDSGRPNI